MLFCSYFYFKAGGVLLLVFIFYKTGIGKQSLLGILNVPDKRLYSGMDKTVLSSKDPCHRALSRFFCGWLWRSVGGGALVGVLW